MKSLPTLVAAGILGILVVFPVRGQVPPDFAAALKKTAAWESYHFQVEGGALEGSFQKNQPLYCKADKVEIFKRGEELVYLDNKKWQRSKKGRVSDPLRVLGGIARVRRLRLPHEELAQLAKILKAVKADGMDKDLKIFSAALNPETARLLARSEHRQVARGGKVRFWLNPDGTLARYAIEIRLQGRIGNAEIDGKASQTVILSGINATKIEVPAEAARLLGK